MLSSPLCSSDLVALLTVPYNHSPYSLLLLEQTIGNPDKHFLVHGAWSSSYRPKVPAKCYKHVQYTIITLSQIPTMGPKLHDTRARPLCEDAIFRLIQEDDDGNVNDSIEGPVTWGRGGGRGSGRGGKGKVATSIDPGHEPPTSTLEDRSRHRREKQPCVPDIWQFVVKGSITKGIKTICKLCYPPVEYLPSTSTGSLRMQIEACHAYEYLEACHENDWPIKLKSLALPKSRFKVVLVNWIVADDQLSKLINILI
ncbi:hypothetical protein JB92DRAFT_2838992 [Gautieria morchelliformis]|nr:hypothetical protein JB92DRAFT_2838992 [Gautieria morchelliformis]